MGFFGSAITILQTLVVAIGAGLGVWGVINLMEGYGNDNPGAKSQGINRVTVNRGVKSTWYYIDEFHLLLKEEQTASYSVEIFKRFRKWGGIPTGITQNIKDLLSSREIENIFGATR